MVLGTSIFMKILAIKLRAIGDTVLWTPALSALKEAYPAAEIHVVTFAVNAPVLQKHPAVAQMHLLKSKSHFELLQTLWRLRSEHFDILLGFHATTSLCRWAWLAGARKKVLHHHSRQATPRGSLPVPHAGELEDAVTRDYRVLEALQIETSRKPTGIALTDAEKKWAREQMQARIGDSSKPIYLFLPGGSYNLKRYPKDLWWKAIERVQVAGEYQPVVICDRALSEEWNLRAECAAKKIPLFDQESLRQVIALIGQGTTTLANDSGPGHISAALGVKTSFVFGPGCFADFYVYDPKVHPYFRAKVDCRTNGPRDRDEFQFCTVKECTHHKCMRELPPI